MFGIGPAVSSTGIIVVSKAFFCRLPHQKYAPSCVLASSSRRLVTGDCQLTCVIALGWFSLVVYASGARTDAPNPRPVPSPPPSHAMQWYCTLDQTLSLLRGVTCQVTRPLPC